MIVIASKIFDNNEFKNVGKLGTRSLRQLSEIEEVVTGISHININIANIS